MATNIAPCSRNISSELILNVASYPRSVGNCDPTISDLRYFQFHAPIFCLAQGSTHLLRTTRAVNLSSRPAF
jgi:hypothetical protein